MCYNKNMKECKVEGCNRKHRAKGYCNIHYNRWRKYGSPLITKHRVECSVDGCEREHHSGGYCSLHYGRNKRWGDPLIKKETKIRVCSIENCNKKHYGNGYCVVHYYRNKRRGNPLTISERFNHDEFCSIENCNKKYFARGYCKAHWTKYCVNKESKRESSSKRRALKRNAKVEKNIPSNIRQILLIEQDYKCNNPYCGKTLDIEKTKEYNLDHIVSLAKGGSHSIDNFQVLCCQCNNSKYNKDYNEFLEEYRSKNECS